MSQFSKNIYFLRNLRGFKQTQISDLLGIKLSTWNNYEKEASQPNLEGLIHISQFFGVSESDLLHSDLHNASLTGDFDIETYQLKSKPKSKPISKPNQEKKPYKYAISDEKEGLVAEDNALFYANQTVNESEVVAALREVIETQKTLISSLNSTIELLKDQLLSVKKS